MCFRFGVEDAERRLEDVEIVYVYVRGAKESPPLRLRYPYVATWAARQQRLPFQKITT